MEGIGRHCSNVRGLSRNDKLMVHPPIAATQVEFPVQKQVGALSRSAFIYALYLSRVQLDRKTQWITSKLNAFLPRRLGENSLAILSLYLLGILVLETAVFTIALFGLLKVIDPLTTLAATFAFLLAIAFSVGTNTVGRTVIPQGEHWLLLTPVPDRHLHLLTFTGTGLLSLIENVLITPIVVGVSASVVLQDEVSLVGLWSATVLVMSAGPMLAYVVDRSLGFFRVRRVSRGLRATSLAWYGIVSSAIFIAGWLAARVSVPWLHAFPGRVEQSNQWVLSFPDYASNGLHFLVPLLAHEISPSGALARVALGEADSMLVVAIWVTIIVAGVVFLWPGSGGWYRSDWRGGWQEWKRKDLFDFAEAFYLRVSGLFYGENVLLGVQVRNLCRRREWAAANVFDLVGGAFNWFPVGLALGAAPIVSKSPTAAAVFAIFCGAFQGAENARGPFVFFRGALALDAEGRQAGMYRASGVSIWHLYRAKIRLGRLISVPPLLVSLILIAILGGIPPSAWLILFATATAAWTVALHAELLPSLISPHFDWDHPDDIEEYYERDKLADWSSKLSGGLFIVELALVGLLLSGKPSYGVLVFMASGLLITIAVSVTIVVSCIGQRVARFNDRTDLAV